MLTHAFFKYTKNVYFTEHITNLTSVHMGRSALGKFLFISIMCFVYLQSCVKDDPATLIPPAPKDQSFVEEFDTVGAAYDRGWRYINVSLPRGPGFWNQGMFNNPNVTNLPAPIPFAAYSSHGSYVGFIGTDYTSTSAAAGIISNWIVSPVVTMQNGDKIVFYTRTVMYDLGGGDSSDFVNRLQVRYSSKNESVNVGVGNDPGDFTNAILDVNPFYKEAILSSYDPEAYPIRWTRFEATVGGLNGAVKGRFAFRYYMENAGSSGYGSGIGIDSVAYIGKH